MPTRIKIELKKRSSANVTTDVRRDEIRDPLSRFLLELAKQLLRAGVSLPDFRALTERAFVLAAADACRFRTKRPNKSAVAAMTGLTRAQVRLLLSADYISAVSAGAQFWSVIEGWRTDAEFLSRAGLPRPLSVKGKDSEFAILVKKYSRDIPSKALLHELSRRGLVVSTSTNVKLITEEHGSSAERLTVRLLRTLEMIVALPDIERDELRGVFCRAAEIDVPEGVSEKLVRRRLQEGAETFLDTAKTAAVAFSKRVSKDKGLKRTKVLALLIESKSKGRVVARNPKKGAR